MNGTLPSMSVPGGAGATSADPLGASVSRVTGAAGDVAADPAAADERLNNDSDDEGTPDDDFACVDVDTAENLESNESRLQVNVVTCVERWRNAGPESRKKMFALFAITGVFVCICRHGHPLVICDMVRSGELCVNSFSGCAVADDTHSV